MPLKKCRKRARAPRHPSSRLPLQSLPLRHRRRRRRLARPRRARVWHPRPLADRSNADRPNVLTVEPWAAPHGIAKLDISAWKPPWGLGWAELDLRCDCRGAQAGLSGLSPAAPARAVRSPPEHEHLTSSHTDTPADVAAT